MKTKISSDLNWTKNTKFKSKIFFPENIEEIKTLLKKKMLFLPETKDPLVITL